MKLRDRAELQRVHDMLIAIVLEEIPIEIADDITRCKILGSLDALCWMLGHDHNTSFQNLIDDIRAEMASTGIVEIDTGKPHRVH
jgi:hypothetical protein